MLRPETLVYIDIYVVSGNKSLNMSMRLMNGAHRLENVGVNAEVGEQNVPNLPRQSLHGDQHQCTSASEWRLTSLYCVQENRRTCERKASLTATGTSRARSNFINLISCDTACSVQQSGPLALTCVARNPFSKTNLFLSPPPEILAVPHTQPCSCETRVSVPLQSCRIT